MRSPSIRAWLIRLVALTTLASGLVLVPLPEVVSADSFAAEVQTVHVALPLRHGLRSAGAIAADAERVPTLRQAIGGEARRAVTGRTPLNAIGVTVAAIPAEPILVRGLVAGQWGPWAEVPFEPDEGPDGRAGKGAAIDSEPVWLGDATAYELDGPGSVRDLDAHLVSDRKTGTTRKLVTPQAEAAGAPSVLGRAAWGARPPKEQPVTTADLRLAIVHHSVSATSYSSGQVPAILRSIQAYHQDVHGWSDFAYNFAVDRFGRIWEGHAGGIEKSVLGGHSRGFNTSTVGVVVLGDFTNVQASSAAIEGVSKVIAWKFALNRIDPGTTVPYTTSGSAKYAERTTITMPRIVGHRDVQSTSCPGNGLYGQLGSIRRRVAQLVPSYQAGVLPDLVAGDFNGDGLTDALEVHTGSAAERTWVPNGVGGFTHSSLAVTRPYHPVTGDLDGDGRADVLWHGTGSAPDSIWWGDGTSQSFQVNGSFLPVTGDFDGDHRDDVLWYAPGMSPDSIWYSNAGHGHTASSITQDLSTLTPVVGDFDGNGRDDVFWYGPDTVADSLWWSTGRGWQAQSFSVDRRYTVTALHDGAQGRDELLFVGPPGATSARWEIDAAHHVVGRTLNVPGSLGTPTVGDFDGDGNDDLLLITTSGKSAIWYSNATTMDVRSMTISRTYLTAVGPMRSSAVGDDVLLVSPTGTDYLWRSNSQRTIDSVPVT